YETGLEQLDFASGQVAVMQQNLIDLQPLLVETSDKTEKLMIKIEQDTVVVEKQKEVKSYNTLSTPPSNFKAHII
ncbi:jg1407, partial [Pararge aegeria aegeria]